MTDIPQGGWVGTVLDAMRIDPTYRPDCEWMVYEAKGPDDNNHGCPKPATWLFRYEHGFVTVRCDEHVDSLPSIVNKLLSKERLPPKRHDPPP